jgi:hypothetical protein
MLSAKRFELSRIGRLFHREQSSVIYAFSKVNDHDIKDLANRDEEAVASTLIQSITPLNFPENL